jgi:hypothetical protein
LKGAWVADFLHVEDLHSVRRNNAKDYKENGNSYFIHGDLLYFLRYSRRVGKLPTSLRIGFGFLE